MRIPLIVLIPGQDEPTRAPDPKPPALAGGVPVNAIGVIARAGFTYHRGSRSSISTERLEGQALRHCPGEALAAHITSLAPVRHRQADRHRLVTEA